MKRDTTLLTSAVEFLVEAFSNYETRKPSFAIVHAVTSAELVLKERLARIHPNLIFQNIDASDFAKQQTVSLRHLPLRLLNLGVMIEPQEVRLVQQCADWRNQIVHHLPAFDPQMAEVQFPKMLDFIASFMRRELDTSIETVLPTELFRTANLILTEWQRVLAEAQHRASNERGVLVEACPQCGGDHVLCLSNETKVYCHLCHSHCYRLQECVQCGRQTVSRLSPFAHDNYCDDCIEAAGDEYIQHLIDMERGK